MQSRIQLDEWPDVWVRFDDVCMKGFRLSEAYTRQPQWHHGVRHARPYQAWPSLRSTKISLQSEHQLSRPGSGDQGCRMLQICCAGFHDVCLSGILVHLVLRMNMCGKTGNSTAFPTAAKKWPTSIQRMALVRDCSGFQVFAVCYLRPSGPPWWILMLLC